MLLGEGGEAIERWKQVLRDRALGERRAALVGFPMLEPLLGRLRAPFARGVRRQRSASDRPALQRLFVALASQARPLVVFFDDLQWADAATLAFIERAAQDGQSTLIGRVPRQRARHRALRCAR